MIKKLEKVVFEYEDGSKKMVGEGEELWCSRPISFNLGNNRYKRRNEMKKVIDELNDELAKFGCEIVEMIMKPIQSDYNLVVIDQKAYSVLDYIRKNIPLERVIEIEKKVPHFKEYVNEGLMETVFRGHRGSFKVGFSKDRGIKFLSLILYLLTGEPKEWDYRLGEKLPKKIESMLPKHFCDFGNYEGCFYKYAAEYAKAKIERKTETEWVLIGPYVFKLLGGEIFFYCTLKAMLKVIRRALEDPTYEYSVMTWEEGITEYLISELKVVDEEE